MLDNEFLRSVYPSLGNFIVFEGYNGVGKTTLVEAMGKYLEGKQIQTVCTYEPTKNIRDFTLIEISISTEQPDVSTFLFDRFEHLSDVISPALAQGKTVLCDRHDWSTLVYQDVTTPKLKEVYLEILNLIFPKNWMQPDLYVYCYADPELIQQRLIERDGESESIDEIQKVCDRYDDIIDFFYNNHPSKLLVFEIEEGMTVEQQLIELYLGIEEKLWI